MPDNDRGSDLYEPIRRRDIAWPDSSRRRIRNWILVPAVLLVALLLGGRLLHLL
jgi:hypothetical protein